MSESFWSTTLLLIRHGQARAGDGSYGKDTPLSALGRRQAAQIARALAASRTPTAVYTSPYPRAVETAQPLCQRLGLQPIVDVRLAEFDLNTTSFEEMQQRPDLVIWHPDHTGVAHGETLAAFATRVAAFCDDIVARHQHTYIAIFAHSGTIDAALRWTVGLAPHSLWQHDFDLATASITELEVWPRGRIQHGAPRYTVIRHVGDVTHLGDLVSDL